MCRGAPLKLKLGLAYRLEATRFAPHFCNERNEHIDSKAMHRAHQPRGWRGSTLLRRALAHPADRLHVHTYLPRAPFGWAGLRIEWGPGVAYNLHGR